MNHPARSALVSVALFVTTGQLFLGTGAHAAAPPEVAQPQFTHRLPNLPGKTLTTVIVEFPPGSRAAPHRHGQAFVYAYVLEGAVRSQLDDQPVRLYLRGQDWFEPPGAHHVLTENASQTHAARLLVVFVADDDTALKIPDQPGEQP